MTVAFGTSTPTSTMVVAGLTDSKNSLWTSPTSFHWSMSAM